MDGQEPASSHSSASVCNRADPVKSLSNGRDYLGHADCNDTVPVGGFEDEQGGAIIEEREALGKENKIRRTGVCAAFSDRNDDKCSIDVLTVGQRGNNLRWRKHQNRAWRETEGKHTGTCQERGPPRWD